MSKKELKDFASENLLHEKLFIVSGITVGRQMVNRMAREGHSSINLKIATLQGLAFEIAEEHILNKEILVIDNVLGNNLILSILKDLSEDEGENFFFREHLIDAKTAEEVYRVILELKYSGLEDFPEIKNLDKIYKEYKARLKDLNGKDYCDIISLATDLEELEKYKDMKIAVASNIEFFNIEKKLFESLTEKSCTRIIMPVSSIDNKPKNYYYKDETSTGIIENKKMIFKDEYGTRNEINYIIEDIKKKRIKLDNVVIAYTNSKYANLINIEFEKNDIPITFGEGLGIKSSSTYRFMETIINWSNDYFNVNKIRSIFVNGDVKLDFKGKVHFSGQELFRELLELHIGFGRENYIKRLSASNRGQVLWLREFFEDLFLTIPEDDYVNIKHYIPRLINLIRKYVRNLNKFDGAAKIEILKTLKTIEDIHMEVSRTEFFDIVINYIEGSRILRTQPQPGHVFASNFKHCGYSGRENLYLIGMDSNSLSNKLIESPILLDFNRWEISEDLSSAKDVYDYKKYKIRELLTADFKNITLIYSNFNTIDVKDKSPSQIYIELKAKYEIEDNNKENREYELYGRDLVSSVTALETLAECSRKAYFKYKLGLEPREEVEILVHRWLNPLDKGRAVHKVLNAYFDSEGQEDLEELVDFQCRKIREKVVCVLEDVYIREKQEILEICENIIDTVEKDKEWEILVNELSFGSSRMKKNKVFGTLPIQKIDVMGLELDVSGSIDRVDVNRENPNLFRIVDYKTGNINNFEKKLRDKKDGFDYSETKKLQYYIYKKALENILEDNKDTYPDFEVANFIYIFGSRKNRNTIDLDFNEDFIKTIEKRIKELLDINILEADKYIVYDPENRNLNCKYCEYSPICITDREVSIDEK